MINTGCPVQTMNWPAVSPISFGLACLMMSYLPLQTREPFEVQMFFERK